MSGILMGLITTLHILACVSLMVAILLQSGKGGGLAGTFGAGSSQTLFGGRGAATFLSRAAGTLAVVFFLTSLTLSLTSTRQGVAGGRSLITEEAKRRASQGQRPAESNAPPPLGGATTPGQGLTPPAATPPAATTPPATPAPAPKTSTAPAKKAPAAQPPAASTTQPAEQAPAANAPSTNTTAPTPPANTTTQGGQ
ncbi:MAG TPA: preprotein translocase subunit SecG [Candidatus Eisenbacteria bacterium]|jgi:preprotein translocase subunit SecG|nr:preprotein translocase subunit SecG [Candidatus Eisenbacteria bacterium]